MQTGSGGFSALIVSDTGARALCYRLTAMEIISELINQGLFQPGDELLEQDNLEEIQSLFSTR